MIRLSAVAVAVSCLSATFALAQGSTSPEEAAVKARKAHMGLYAHNLGVIGGMAQENIPYDAAKATAAAGNIAALASIDQTSYWIEGTSTEDMEGTRALPVIFENMADVAEQNAALLDAAVAMQEAAAVDLASLKGAMGALGGACGACHEDYRQPN